MNGRFRKIRGRRLNLPGRLMILACGLLGLAPPAAATFCIVTCETSVKELIVRPGDPIRFDAFAVSSVTPCSHDVKISMIARPPFMQPEGHVLGRPVPSGVAAVLKVDQIAGRGRPGTYWAKFEARELDSHFAPSVCKVRITLLPPLCKAPPVCEVSEAGPIEATIGGEPVEFTVCVEAGCEGAHAALTLEDLPGFLGLQGESRDAQGRCCYTFRIYPCSDDAGTYSVTFKAKNTDGGLAEGECSVDIVILDAEE